MNPAPNVSIMDLDLSTSERTLELSSSPRRSSPQLRRRLVDYTQCRSDGTSSTAANAGHKAISTNDYFLKAKLIPALGLPSCRALDASLADLMAVPEEKTEDEERIDFFLKVAPKSQRRQSRRVSTLDTVGGRRVVMERIASSRRSLKEIPMSRELANATLTKSRRKSDPTGSIIASFCR